MKNNILIIFLFLISCEKDELPIKPHVSGDEITNTVVIGNDYKNQVFFSLEKNEVISSNVKTDWDLAFESTISGDIVRLNTSKGMAVSKRNQPFEAVLDTSGSIWQWDAHSGNRDSTAIGDWLTFNGVYIIDRGYDQLGNHQGFSKIKILSGSATSYQILYAPLNSITGQSTTITKNELYTFAYFNLTTGFSIPIAPKKTEWDILFTQYVHLFDGPIPYLVTGVLLNPENTSAAIIKELPFSEIAFENVTNLEFSNAWNTIGYDWKYFNFDLGVYEVDAATTYIIQTQKGYFYKFHFIDFYNESGIKGYPKFEYQKL